MLCSLVSNQNTLETFKQSVNSNLSSIQLSSRNEKLFLLHSKKISVSLQKCIHKNLTRWVGIIPTSVHRARRCVVLLRKKIHRKSISEILTFFRHFTWWWQKCLCHSGIPHWKSLLSLVTLDLLFTKWEQGYPFTKNIAREKSQRAIQDVKDRHPVVSIV